MLVRGGHGYPVAFFREGRFSATAVRPNGFATMAAGRRRRRRSTAGGCLPGARPWLSRPARRPGYDWGGAIEQAVLPATSLTGHRSAWCGFLSAANGVEIRKWTRCLKLPNEWMIS